MTQSSSNAGIVHLFRKPAYNSLLVAVRFEVDGAVLGSLRQGQQLSVYLAAGRHSARIVASGPGGHSAPLVFDIAAGQELEMVCAPTWRVRDIWDLRLERWRQAGVSSPAADVYGPSGRQGLFGGPGPAAGPYAEQGLAGAAPLPAPGPSPARVPVQGSAPVPQPPTVEIVETHRSEEPLGEETRTVDNRGSDTAVTRAVKASREWSRTLTIGFEKARTLAGEASTGPKWLALKGSIESALTRSYSSETSARESMAEEIEISVPAHTSTQLVLAWKRIWQHGVVRVTDATGAASEVPFQVVVGVTFDQSQRDSH